MFQTYVLSQLNDLADCGVDETLDQLQSLGATGITLGVIGSARMYLRSRSVTPRIVRSRGGYLYTVDPAYYDETHLKPIVSATAKSRQSLDKIIAACRARDLKVRLRMSLLEIGRMAEKHPEAAGKTAFGDLAPEALCPANPDVRALLRGTLRELHERFEPDAIELADLRYHSGAFGFGGLALGFDPGPAFLSLLSVCFSESSRQAAAERDIDTDAALRWTQVALERVLESGDASEDSFEDMLRDAEIPLRYLQCQQDTLDAFIVGLIRNTPTSMHLVLPGDTEEGVTPSPVSVAQAAGVIIEAEVEEPEDVAANMTELRRRYGDDVNVTLDLDAAGDLGAEAQLLVSAVKACADQDASAVSFSEWGLMPADRLEGLKQAIRYASRSSA